jgi:hypothetical protein
VTGSPAAMLMLFVLFVVISAGIATFFPRKLAALSALVGIPIAVFVNSALGGLYTLLLIVLAAILVALLQTISETFALIRASERTRPAPTQHRTAARRSERSRIAA